MSSPMPVLFSSVSFWTHELPGLPQPDLCYCSPCCFCAALLSKAWRVQVILYIRCYMAVCLTTAWAARMWWFSSLVPKARNSMCSSRFAIKLQFEQLLEWEKCILKVCFVWKEIYGQLCTVSVAVSCLNVLNQCIWNVLDVFCLSVINHLCLGDDLFLVLCIFCLGSYFLFDLPFQPLSFDSMLSLD